MSGNEMGVWEGGIGLGVRPPTSGSICPGTASKCPLEGVSRDCPLLSCVGTGD
jgi:hypothetical protein